LLQLQEVVLSRPFMVEIVYATIKRHLMANKVEGWVWLGLECLKCRRCCLII